MLGVVRAPFFTAVIVPVLLGTAIAGRQGSIHWGLFAAALLGAVAVNAALNMSNDYFDHRSGNDASNRELTPFSGGSRSIQDGVISPRGMLLGSFALYAVTIGIGLFLAATRGWPLLALGAGGLFLAFFHNAPPFRLYHLWPGAGELAVGIGCGPIVVLGAYYVQRQAFSLEALLASIPVALLITAVLYINGFPDAVADGAVGKKTFPVVFGRRRAAWGYVGLLVAAYASIIIGVSLRVLPLPLLLGLLSLPLAVRGIRGALRHHSDTAKLIPVNASTVGIHLVTGLLLCVGYLMPPLL